MSNITLKRGDSFRARVTILVNGEPQDLDGFGIRCKLMSATDELIRNFAIDPGNMAAGQFFLNAPFADTKAWEPGTYRSDIEVTWPDETFRVSSPDFTATVTRDVTRTQS